MNSPQLELLKLKLLEVSVLDYQPLTLSVMEKLISQLSELTEDASDFQKMFIFKNSILEINKLAEEIDTEDRETFLDFFYSAATIAGFSNKGDFAEQWRGDW
ncbi:hypothetical protein JTE78_25690 [Pseudomonas syringae pv. aptata]|uniref:hypothetical protein n=1 Tax=Pseudomonas syringae TaxID=317 RepID=UPI00203DA1B2|nr:hypothetical protein [Pseudomonas syringae]MCK0546032.1 hypothetical protein [Pseudomonas syringae pv. aptata]